MATINFIAGGYGLPINNLSNSGLGFFGAGGFGTSVSVGAYQGSTFITDGNGVNQGPQVNNVQYVATNSGEVQNGTILNLTSIPNYQSTLNIQFLNSTACMLQSSYVYIYDRVSINNLPSGVTTAVANIIHPNTSQITGGSGSTTWQFPAGSSYIILSQLGNGNPFSPGTSGLGINGGATRDIEHDYYIAISASPNSIGSKSYYGLLFSTNYL